jgi:hypothetical protein
MPDSPEIARIDARITRLESSTSESMKSIGEKIDKLTDAINATMLDSARNHCPSPGACISLSAELQHTIAAHNATMLRVERLEIQLIQLHQERAKIIGVWSAIAFMASIVGGGIAFVVGKLWNP